jgi:hypothetical protein
MRALEQAKPAEQSPPSSQTGFHAELGSIWGMPPMLKQAQAFASGVGEGLAGACKEGVQAVGQAVTHPGETINNAVNETGKALKTGCEATAAAANYVGDKVSHGDISGVAHDAQKTGQAIGHFVAEGANHIAHMNAHDLGKFVGHDVLPGVVISAVAPELAGEGLALAAGAMSKLGTLAKEEAALSRVVSVCENAKSKIDAISEKMAGLNKKMEALQHREKSMVRDSFTVGNRLTDGDIVQGERNSEKFLHELKQAQKDLTPFEKNALATAKLEQVHNMPEAYLPNYVAKHGEELGTKMAKEKYRTQGTWQWFEDDKRVSRIRIAETTGLNGDPVPNENVRHSLAHEIGHMIDDEMGGHSPLSARDNFKKLVAKDIEENNQEAEKAMRLLGKLNGDTKRSEIWAELSAHVSAEQLNLPVPNDELSQAIRNGYKNCFKHIQKFNGNFSI